MGELAAALGICQQDGTIEGDAVNEKLLEKSKKQLKNLKDERDSIKENLVLVQQGYNDVGTSIDQLQSSLEKVQKRISNLEDLIRNTSSSSKSKGDYGEEVGYQIRISKFFEFEMRFNLDQNDLDGIHNVLIRNYRSSDKLWILFSTIFTKKIW